MKAQNRYTNELLDAKRLLGDSDADKFISDVFSDETKKLQFQNWVIDKGEISDLTTMFSDYSFLGEAAQLPEWADQKLMNNGATFFAKNSQNIMSLLGLLSLPYCYTAANGAMVLHLSERIRKHTTKRLYDTAVFVWEVMAPTGFGENGSAFKEILKVRLMHAAVRYYTLRSEKWDDSWGLPINQEDMAGTNLSFSLIVVRGLRQLGISVSNSDQMAFLHLWKVVGHFTGLDEDLIPENGKMATQLDSAIKHRQFKTSQHGRELTQSLINHILSLNNGKVKPNDILGLMRHLLGTEIADMLNINAPAFPIYRLTMLKTLNFLKGVVPKGDTTKIYQSAYAAFKKQNPALKKAE